MEEVLPHLFKTQNETPFNNQVVTCAYFIKRNQGNFLLYSSSKIERHFEDILNWGGVQFQFLGHSHEASPFCDKVREKFNAPLIIHTLEKKETSKQCKVSLTFDESFDFSPDFRAIHLPGHTEGGTCFLWKNENKKILFTSDFIYLNKGIWTVSVDKGNELKMIESLEKLKELNPHYVMPGLWIGDQFFSEMNKESWVKVLGLAPIVWTVKS